MAITAAGVGATGRAIRNIWRYADLLPVPSDIASRRTTEPGCTPLVRADHLARSLGMRRLWVKDERSNPPIKTSGLRNVVAAARSRPGEGPGLPADLHPATWRRATPPSRGSSRGAGSGQPEPEKILASAAYGCTLIKVEGGYDEVNRLASELAEERDDWAFVNVNVRPYYAEGSKTIGYEIAEALGWRLPEQIVVPVASGAQLVKIDKAFREFTALGLVDDVTDTGPRAIRCPLTAAAHRSLEAYDAGRDFVARWKPNHDRQVARDPGGPADGPYVLDVVRRTGGSASSSTGRRDHRLDQAARGDRGHLRRDRSRRHAGCAAQAAGRRSNLLVPEAETVIINSGDAPGQDAQRDRKCRQRTRSSIKPNLAEFTRQYNTKITGNHAE